MRPAPAVLAGAVFLLAFLGVVLQAASLPRQPQQRHPFLRGQGGGGSGVARGEEKVRLGSSPPSCRGKCYECSPCTAVQVPTLSSAAARSSRPRARARADEVATLSNYKPVGWKCQCRDRLYEP